jgi:acetoacetyl-CoA synthetase
VGSARESRGTAEFGQRLWSPSAERVAGAAMTRFREAVAQQHGVDLPDSTALHAWSVAHPGPFWEAAWHRLGVVGQRGEGPAIVGGPSLQQGAFFPGATLNVTDSLLAGPQDGTAIVATDESGARRTLTWAELSEQASAFAATLRQLGVVPGDRVAAWMPNVPETVIVFLGTAMVGAVFSSASPDFGVPGVLDRFGQIAPRVLVAADGYRYAGKVHQRLDRLREVVVGLPSTPTTFVVPLLARQHGEPSGHSASGVERLPAGMRPWAEAMAPRAEPQPAALPFDHPLLVLYSSGTTGVPKAIVHRGGGVLLKHLVEHQLHCDVRTGDRVLYFTTCGWMMWNWLVSALASRATIVLYDGSPTHPDPDVLFELAERERVTLFGTSAKYLDAVARIGLRPRRQHDLTSLRTVTSTGSPLSPEGFGYVYEAVAEDVHLASISGGTDIVGCFVLGDPTRPVHAGEIQGPALGLDVDVVDSSGRSLAGRPGVRGDLVCRNRFPSMPLGFWGDDGSRYRAAYFEANPGLWTHGDFASLTQHGGFVIHGRSDATLNAGGVRIGTAEIYRQVEALPEVAECLAIGQEWEGDTRIVLFVVPAPGVTLDDRLAGAIRTRLRVNCSPRHVPARIVAVPDLPRTRSGKLAELAVRDVVHGREVANVEALANPEALEHVRDRPELA